MTALSAALAIALFGSAARAQPADVPDGEEPIEEPIEEPAEPAEPEPEPAPEEKAVVVETEPAPSQPAAPPQPPAPDRSYWTITFAGLLLEPLGDLAQTHDSALATAMRVGFTGNSKFGFDATLRYTPFPHEAPPDAIVEAHFVFATVAPTYAVKWSVLRAWVAVGAGGVFERVRTTAEDDPDDTAVESFAAVTAHAAAGVEAHLFDNGGPMVGASYSHGVVGDDYILYGMFGGVTFAFE